ncbi:hypothetical protein [Sphingomonas sp. PP-CE-1G-424]|uniref:hypothetical protein n=1 Tax=Sphingomonas sp. PP-CE-1G-424 TaxID=2135658 RepID=UPI001056ABC2|nr:hypothetical protein [Sphingomonas sp. PP-CE-1G-424]TCP65380.1 hypothetical protein C8J43_11236 [Sphingomonas sp. PP-CE-1G-424]
MLVQGESPVGAVAMTLRFATSRTAVPDAEHTNAWRTLFEKAIGPGGPPTSIRATSEKPFASRTEMRSSPTTGIHTSLPWGA